VNPISRELGARFTRKERRSRGRRGRIGRAAELVVDQSDSIKE
jgi:hypothetical protein